jgi:prepilin peptidase CpaA
LDFSSLQPQELTLDVLLVLTALIGAVTDARSGKIYNWLTFPAMVMGLAINTGLNGYAGFKLSVFGLAAGIGIQFIPWTLGLVKGGDVKFLGAAGALKGPAFVFYGFLYGAALFGLFAIVALGVRGDLRKSLINIRELLRSWVVLRTDTEPGEPASKAYMPWGIALALGFLVALALELTIGTPYWFR